MKRIAYVLSFVFGLFLAACGSDAPPALTCGTGGSCSCEPGMTCNFSTNTCGVDGGSCTLECLDMNTCTGTCGESCSVTCAGGSTCSPTVAASGSVTCSDGSTCHIECTGSCSVSCSSATCDLTCAGQASAMDVSGTGGSCP